MSTRPTSLTVLTVVLGVVAGFGAWVTGHGSFVVGLSLAGLGLVQVAEDTRRAKAARVRKALLLTGYSIKSAALTMGLDPADFVRALNADRKLDTWRLEMLGDEFMRTLAFLEIQDRGLPSFAVTAAQVALSTKGER